MYRFDVGHLSQLYCDIPSSSSPHMLPTHNRSAVSQEQSELRLDKEIALYILMDA